ncbi:MAG: prepilin-type N-terminal cleavage/methylation domain-containing protein [Lachnospiraceae bacterium]|nr:prepilin-type N-terminal cleavage/methylation domain-containing protein [Lachnospiraceae bacterium]
MRKATKGRCKKLNNKGLSLVEVLAAMLILSVVSIVFLRSFSYSMQVNQKAKRSQDELHLAQSLMEGIKAYDKATLDTEFASGGTSFKLYPLSGSETTSSTSNGEGRTYTLNGVTVEGESYDVKIEMTPTTKTAQLVKAPGVNKYTDAFFKQEVDEQSGILPAVSSLLSAQGHVGSATPDADDVKITKREIEVTIDTDGNVTVTSTYSFTASDFEITKADGTKPKVTVSGSLTESYNCNDMSTAVAGADLKGLYLYYYPAYKDTGNGLIDCEEDDIIINNDCTSLENVHIIKQKSSILGPAYLSSGESTYSVEVDVTTGSPLKLYHNLGKRLTSEDACSYTISGTDVTDMGAPWAEEATVTVLLYDVDIQIMQSGSSEVEYELKGSTNVK